MTDLWLVPDDDEELVPSRHHWLHALSVTDRRMIAYRVRMIRLLPVGEHKRSIESLGRAYGVTERTADRYANDRYPCPGPRCMTNVRGGGLCNFCRRTP